MTSKIATNGEAVEKPIAQTAVESVAETTKKKATRKTAAKSDITLADLAERYIRHLEEDGKSPGTCFSYTAELKLACKEIGAETKIADITTDRVQKYFDSKAVTTLKASGRKKAKPSVDKSRRVLRLALVWAAEKKWIKSAPIPETTKN